MKTALLDTNVLIQFEDNRQLKEEDALLLRQSSDKVNFFIHPIQIEEINKDSNQKRKNLFLSKIQRYSTLDTKFINNAGYFENFGWKSSCSNDLVDNNLLDCVQKNVVNLLITNDKGIHKKAKISKLSDRVLKPEQLLDMFPVEEPVDLCCVKDVYCYSLDTEDVFFDSLREDYSGFNDWLERCKPAHRKCWLIEDGGKIQSLCIYKVGSSHSITDDGFNPGYKMLKLCTFKVANYATGIKMGERLLFSAFQFAMLNDIGYVYLTMYTNKQMLLVELLENFGFKNIGKKGSEDVYGKYTKVPSLGDITIEKHSFDVRYYPSYMDDLTVKKFIVPIIPAYHNRLFPDCKKSQMSLFKDHLASYNSESFTIKKSYITKSKIKKISPGDLLLFYRTRDLKSIQVLGFVDSVERLNSLDDIIENVNKRTVYTKAEISEKLDKSDELLIVNFNLIKYSSRGIGRDILNRLGVVSIRSIVEIDDEIYNKIMEAWSV